MSEVFDKIAQIEKLLEEVKGLVAVGQYVTPTVETPKPKSELPPVEKAAPTKSELKLDYTKVDYLDYGTKIKPTMYLDNEVWGNINKLLFAEGYHWDKEARAWLFQPEEAGKSAPQKAATTATKGAKVIRISDITTDSKSPTIEGTLENDPSQRDIDTKRGPTSITKFKVNDGSATAEITFWGDSGDPIMDLVKGKKVRVTSLLVKEPYDGMPQFTAGKYTKVVEL